MQMISLFALSHRTLVVSWLLINERFLSNILINSMLLKAMSSIESIRSSNNNNSSDNTNINSVALNANGFFLFFINKIELNVNFQQQQKISIWFALTILG